MKTDKQVSILMDCFDLLAGMPFNTPNKDYHGLAQYIIDSLNHYPQPTPKEKVKRQTSKKWAAYLYVSTARNTMKLAQLKYISYYHAFSFTCTCMEIALSLLTGKD
jgi:hypothetical protein